MKFLVTLVAVAALVAGCGGSSGGSSTAGSQAAASSSSSASSSSVAGTSSSTPSASSSAPTFASTSNCQALVDMARKYVAEVEASAAGGGQANFGTLVKADQAMADASPSDIH